MMETVFLVCAAVGGTLLLCQFLLGLFGFGHHDFDHDHGFDHHVGDDHAVGHDHESWFFSILTFRALVAALTFYGLTGMVMINTTDDSVITLVGAAIGGAAALFTVGWLLRLLQSLKAEGNVRIDRAVGTTGTVYISIPGNNSGVGKVTVKLQNRTVEYQATTRHDVLPTGTPIEVVAVVGPDTVEVIPVPQPQRISHV